MEIIFNLTVKACKSFSEFKLLILACIFVGICHRRDKSLLVA